MGREEKRGHAPTGRPGRHGHEERLVRVTVSLEEDQIAHLKEIAGEYREKLGSGWSLSAIMRVAVGDFLTRMGRIA
ncbi:MAG: hypothetical protein HY890_06470 [Deltaproteobacteria bacterium]|nr:hypothetical protein [Deltaproteobacteria bacterium]